MSGGGIRPCILQGTEATPSFGYLIQDIEQVAPRMNAIAD